MEIEDVEPLIQPNPENHQLLNMPFAAHSSFEGEAFLVGEQEMSPSEAFSTTLV